MLNYPVMYSLSERESSSKRARNCIYHSNIENSSCIKNLICRCLLCDCEMCSQELYVLYRDLQLVYVVGLWYGKVAKNCMSYCIPFRCKIEQPDTYNIMGWQILKCKCARKLSSLVKNTWKLLTWKLLTWKLLSVKMRRVKMRRATH